MIDFVVGLLRIGAPIAGRLIGFILLRHFSGARAPGMHDAGGHGPGIESLDCRRDRVDVDLQRLKLVGRLQIPCATLALSGNFISVPG